MALWSKLFTKKQKQQPDAWSQEPEEAQAPPELASPEKLPAHPGVVPVVPPSPREIDIQTYATIQAQLAQVAPQGLDAIEKILAQYDLDVPAWKKIDTQWMHRLTQGEDAIAEAALVKEYGESYRSHFAKQDEGNPASS